MFERTPVGLPPCREGNERRQLRADTSLDIVAEMQPLRGAQHSETFGDHAPRMEDGLKQSLRLKLPEPRELNRVALGPSVTGKKTKVTWHLHGSPRFLRRTGFRTTLIRSKGGFTGTIRRRIAMWSCIRPPLGCASLA